MRLAASCVLTSFSRSTTDRHRVIQPQSPYNIVAANGDTSCIQSSDQTDFEVWSNLTSTTLATCQPWGLRIKVRLQLPLVRSGRLTSVLCRAAPLHILSTSCPWYVSFTLFMYSTDMTLHLQGATVCVPIVSPLTLPATDARFSLQNHERDHGPR